MCLIYVLVENKDPFILYSQYHGCWWPGDLRRQGISCYGTDIVYPEYWGLKKGQSILQIQCYSCWWPGGARDQGISNYCIVEAWTIWPVCRRYFYCIFVNKNLFRCKFHCVFLPVWNWQWSKIGSAVTVSNVHWHVYASPGDYFTWWNMLAPSAWAYYFTCGNVLK